MNKTFDSQILIRTVNRIIKQKLTLNKKYKVKTLGILKGNKVKYSYGKQV